MAHEISTTEAILGGGFLAQAAGWLWWIATLGHRVKTLETIADPSAPARLVALETEMATMRPVGEAVARIEGRLQGVLDAIQELSATLRNNSQIENDHRRNL